MHSNRDVGEHRLGTRRGDRDTLRRIVGERIAQVIEAAVFLAVLRFFVAQ